MVKPTRWLVEDSQVEYRRTLGRDRSLRRSVTSSTSKACRSELATWCIDEAALEHGRQKAHDAAHVEKAAPALLGTICKIIRSGGRCDASEENPYKYYGRARRFCSGSSRATTPSSDSVNVITTSRTSTAALADVMGVDTSNPMAGRD